MPVKGRNSFGIPYVRTGIPVLDQTLWKILDALDQLRIQPSTTASGMTGPGGTLVSAAPSAPRWSAGGLFRHPYQVSLVDTATPSTPTAALSASSRLYKSISPTDTQAITALTTAFTLASNTYVWVEVTVSALAVTAAERKTGTAWPTFIVTSGSPAAQTQFNIPVGRVVATDPTKPGFEFQISGTWYHFEQCLFSHLLVENRCNSGISVLYGFPWSGAV